MGQSSVTLLNNQQITNAAVASNGKFDVWTSATQTNQPGYPCLRATIDYASTPPDPPGPVSYSLTLVIEGQAASGQWFPIAYQFEPFANKENGPKRIIVMQPDILDLNAGIDDIVYVGGFTEARISRQQGRLGSSWRARLVVTENGHNTPTAFQSAQVTLNVETYDA